jgi:hypothetical protein
MGYRMEFGLFGLFPLDLPVLERLSIIDCHGRNSPDQFRGLFKQG